MSNISVMIVDSDPGRMEQLSAPINMQKDLRVVSAVSKRETAVKQLSLSPHVMLLNADILKQLTLPRFLRSIKTKSPSTRVLLLHHDDPEDETLVEEIRMGARGYLRYRDTPNMLVKAVRMTANGEIWAERRILEKTILKHLLTPEMLNSHVPDLQPLTGRETDILSMVLKGASNREIATMSNISERTVKTHLYRVYRKLKVKSRTKAIALLSQS